MKYPVSLIGLLAIQTCVVGQYSPGTEKPGNTNPLVEKRNTPNSAQKVIIQFTAGFTPQNDALLRAAGGVRYRDLSLIGGAAYQVPAASLARLKANPAVKSISLDHGLEAAMDITAAAVNATAQYVGTLTGKNVTIAVIDSGITSHPDLLTSTGGSRVLYSQVFRQEITTEDLYGHGTHIAGIAGGTGKQSTGAQYSRTFRGIAPGVNFVNLVVLDRYGQSTDSMVIAAIQTAVSLKSTYNIKIINLSLGRPVFESYQTDPLCQAAEAAWKAGIVVVTSAGNQGRDNSKNTLGYGTITAPGNDPYVITVGSMKALGTGARTDDRVASYSSKGPTIIDHVVKPDLVAPGNKVVSDLAGGGRLRNQYPANDTNLNYYIVNGNNQQGDQYYTMSGTSMATAVVSGAAALMLEKNPNLTPDQVKARLMLTSYKTFPQSSVAKDPTTGKSYTSYYDIFTVGAGYLDVNAALLTTATSTKLALSPIVFYDSLSHLYKLKVPSGLSVVWGDSVAWSDSVVWGAHTFVGSSSVVWGDKGLWNSSVVWGDQTTQGYSVVWGDTAVWGTSTPPGAESDPVAVYGEQ